MKETCAEAEWCRKTADSAADNVILEKQFIGINGIQTRTLLNHRLTRSNCLNVKVSVHPGIAKAAAGHRELCISEVRRKVRLSR